jgi:hypothetical protein
MLSVPQGARIRRVGFHRLGVVADALSANNQFLSDATSKSIAGE